MKAEIAPRPARVGPVTVTVELSDSARQPVSGAQLTLEGDMSHPGMAPVFGDAKEMGAGRYQGVLQLTMGGDWVVLVHGKLQDGHTIEHQLRVNNVAN